MNHALIAATLGFGLAVSGCSGSNGSLGAGVFQTQGNGGGGAIGAVAANPSAGGGCSLGAPQTVGPNDETPLGTPAKLLAAVTGTHLATLTWGTPTALASAGRPGMESGGSAGASSASASASGSASGASDQGAACMVGSGFASGSDGASSCSETCTCDATGHFQCTESCPDASTPGAQPDFVVHPTGTTRLTIDVAPMDGGIQFQTESLADGGYENGVGVGCAPGLLTIAATVRAVTDDRGFDETWQESLVSSDGQSASFTRDLQQMPPAGTFTVSYVGMQTPTSISLPLTATFDASGTGGGVDYQAEFMSSSADSLVHMPVAAWLPLVTDGGLDAAEVADAN
jgi:hypothetical protein